MSPIAKGPSKFVALAQKLAPALQERAGRHDLEGSFVSENYAMLKTERLFAAGVPEELGGLGASHTDLCEMLRELARSCSSTSLALSMHTHLVAAAVYRYRHGQPGEALLRKVAADQLVLVSTGAGDWVSSVGKAERVAGGYRVTASKRFASGCQAGDLALTSAPYDDPERGAEVLHFALPMRSEGVRIREDWDATGMRGTGSHTIEIEGAFVPEEAVTLRRPRGVWHPSWNLVVTVAAPIYMAPYMGVADRAAELARESAKRAAPDAMLLASLGELENQLAVADMAFRDMCSNAADYAFDLTTERTNRTLVRKTILANAVIAAVQKSLETTGGAGLYRKAGIERLLRDIQGAPFHPLPEKKQLQFSGRMALGLDPVA
jgi:alkylation response protein AidB-like acyl-CoA dehydrogenase